MGSEWPRFSRNDDSHITDAPRTDPSRTPTMLSAYPTTPGDQVMLQVSVGHCEQNLTPLPKVEAHGSPG
jgi:hypothetical protein